MHGEAVRLSDLAPLKLVVPSKTNTRRQTIETYCATAGVSIERMLELDAMLATLDFVARTEWVAVLPAIMMADKSGQFTTNPLAEPALNLDLVLIEPSRKLLAPAAEQFLLLLEEEARLLSPELVA